MLQDLQFLLSGGPVMWPLFLCGVVSAAVIMDRLLVIGAAAQDSRRLVARVQEFLQNGQFPEALETCEQGRGAVAEMLAAGLRAARQEGALVERRMYEYALTQRPILTHRLGILDTIVTLAPLLGLLGTVTGMIGAFHVVGKAGLSQPLAITGGVSEALIATSVGLTIAILSLPAYNFLADRVRNEFAVMEWRAAQLLNALEKPPPETDAPQTEPPQEPAARRSKRPPTNIKKARIEIIPMIDTIFFLLVFFMMMSLSMIPVTAPHVNLPASATATRKPVNSVVVSIDRNGDYFVGREKVSGVPEIRSRITARLLVDPGLTVVINCDKDQKLDKFVDVLDVIKQANAANVMVATSPNTPGGAAP